MGESVNEVLQSTVDSSKTWWENHWGDVLLYGLATIGTLAVISGLTKKRGTRFPEVLQYTPANASTPVALVFRDEFGLAAIAI
jgi:hypothetical protein